MLTRSATKTSANASQDEATLAANRCTAATISDYLEAITGYETVELGEVLRSNSTLINLRMWLDCVEAKSTYTEKAVEDYLSKNTSCEQAFDALCQAIHAYEDDKNFINFIGDFMRKTFNATVITDTWGAVIAREGCSDLVRVISRYVETTYAGSILSGNHPISTLFRLLNLLNDSNPGPDPLELSCKILQKIIGMGMPPFTVYVHGLTVEQAFLLCKCFKHVAHEEEAKGMVQAAMTIVFTSMSHNLHMFLLNSTYKERNELWELAKLFEHERMTDFFATHLGSPDFVPLPPMVFTGLPFGGILMNDPAPPQVTTGGAGGYAMPPFYLDVQLEEDPLYSGVPYAPTAYEDARRLLGGL